MNTKPSPLINNKKKWSISPERSPFFYLLPMVIFMIIMIAYPIGRVIYISFTQNILTRPELGISFIGLENYISLFSSIEFWNTLGRTILWTSLSVLGKTIIGFGIAWLLAKEIAFKRIYMFLIMIPWVTPMVVAAIAWKWVFDGQLGVLNYILLNINLISEPIIWFGNSLTAFVATVITDMWLGLPFIILMFLAGLQSIPKEVKESSSIDGANGFQQFRYIILPIMKSIILLAITLSTIWTFNAFGVIWPMTKGGPVDATRTLVVDAYIESFGSFDLGMGAAIAVVIFLTLFILAYFYNRLLKKQDD